MEKYNPDQKHLMYNIAKKKRKDGIDEGIFQKIKHETTEMLAKHLAAEDQGHEWDHIFDVMTAPGPQGYDPDGNKAQDERKVYHQQHHQSKKSAILNMAEKRRGTGHAVPQPSSSSIIKNLSGVRRGGLTASDGKQSFMFPSKAEESLLRLQRLWKDDTKGGGKKKGLGVQEEVEARLKAGGTAHGSRSHKASSKPKTKSKP